MFRDIKDTFKHHIKIEFNTTLYNKLKAYRINWMQKSDDYIEFLGSNLTGVQPIRFSTQDEDMLFIDILNVDQSNLKYDVFKTKGIYKNRKVTSNAFYLTIVYIMHEFLHSKAIGKNRDDVLKELYYIFAYKAISSLITHNFKYNVDPSIAKAVVERLNNRFHLKKYGSWQEVFELRSLDIIPPNGLHAKRLYTLSTDDSGRIISDMQGRLRDMIKGIYTVLIDVKEKNEKIVSTSSLDITEDGVGIKETSNRPDIYIRYVKSIVNIRNDFINDDIVYLVISMFKNVNRDDLVKTLEYISNTDIKEKDYILDSVINSTISYLNNKNINGDYQKKMYDVIKYCKSYYTSSSAKDKDIVEVRKLLNSICITATKKKSKWIISTVVITTMVYIIVRSFYIKK